MDKQKMSLEKKITIVLIVTGICLISFFFVIGPYINRGEGDPGFAFFEVPFNETVNSTVIQLEDADITNIRGVDVRQKNGKIVSIRFRSSDLPPGFSIQDFNKKYGSPLGEPSLRRYLEYKGVYYYAAFLLP